MQVGHLCACVFKRHNIKSKNYSFKLWGGGDVIFKKKSAIFGES